VIVIVFVYSDCLLPVFQHYLNDFLLVLNQFDGGRTNHSAVSQRLGVGLSVEEVRDVAVRSCCSVKTNKINIKIMVAATPYAILIHTTDGGYSIYSCD